MRKLRSKRQKKAARTVICSCREASDATCFSQMRRFAAEELVRAMTHASVEMNIPQYGDEKMKICPTIEKSRLSGHFNLSKISDITR
jgi:hypothetical protein